MWSAGHAYQKVCECCECAIGRSCPHLAVAGIRWLFASQHSFLQLDAVLPQLLVLHDTSRRMWYVAHIVTYIDDVILVLADRDSGSSMLVSLDHSLWCSITASQTSFS